MKSKLFSEATPSISNLSVLSGFPPVIDQNTHTLILGSFPGAKSLEIQQYYGFKHNQFWRLMSVVTGDELVQLSYHDRLTRLLAHGFGLWDVIGNCDRNGSLDSNIRNARINDFSILKHQYPALTHLGFNGKTSAKLAPEFAAAGFITIILPSSSPAYAARTFESKLEDWQQLNGGSDHHKLVRHNHTTVDLQQDLLSAPDLSEDRNLKVHV